MKNKMNRFIQILKIELEDLEEDIEALEKLTEKRYKDHEITEYVLKENIAFYKREFDGIKEVFAQIDAFDTDNFTTVEEMLSGIDIYFQELVEKYQAPNAVYVLLKRKIDKIAKYALQTNN